MILRVGIGCLVTFVLAACGESGTRQGLVARWHDYGQMFMYSTELVRTERFLGTRYRLDVTGQPLHSMDSQVSRKPVYLDRDTPIDSLEAHPLPMLLVDPPGKRIVSFQPVSETEVYYESYPYDRGGWKKASESRTIVSRIDSIGFDTVAGYEARHYRLAVESDSLTSMFSRMGRGFPARMIVDLWLAGPDPLLDEYFAAARKIPLTGWDYDRETMEPVLTFQDHGDDDTEKAVRARFHDAGHVVRSESRIEFHGKGVGQEMPPELDPIRLPAGPDTVRSVLLSRESLASLRRATIAEDEMGVPAGALSKSEWRRKMNGGKTP